MFLHVRRRVTNQYSSSELGNTRCIGEELAMMEMKLTLVLTARDFDFDFGCHKHEFVSHSPHTIFEQRNH